MFIPNIPTNSLKPMIEKMVSIAKLVEGDISCEFHEAATEEEIQKLIDETTLPTDFADILRFSNGFRLGNYSTVEFYDVSYLIRLHKTKKAEWFPKDYIIIADIISDSEVLCYSTETHEYIDYYDGRIRRKFDNFLDAFQYCVDLFENYSSDYLPEEYYD